MLRGFLGVLIEMDIFLVDDGVEVLLIEVLFFKYNESFGLGFEFNEVWGGWGLGLDVSWIFLGVFRVFVIIILLLLMDDFWGFWDVFNWGKWWLFVSVIFFCFVLFWNCYVN